MPFCNGADRGCNITPRKSGQTSLWCRRAWTVSQPAQAVMQICRRERNALSLVLQPPPKTSR